MAVVVGPLNPTQRNGQAIPDFYTAPTWIDVVQLGAGVASTYTLPAAAGVFRLTPTVIPTYATFNGNAAIPSVGVTNGTGSFPVGGQTYMTPPAGLNQLSMICNSACAVIVEAWG
jgi:hypothetical protein